MDSWSDRVGNIKLKFSATYGLSEEMVDEIMELARLSFTKECSDCKIRFKYMDSEYGLLARRWHSENYPLKRSYSGDAGIDLPIILSEDQIEHGFKIWPGEREVFHTGVVMEFPKGYWGRIIHRSSTEKKHRLRIIEGVIDDYRGEILVQVHNTNPCDVTVYHGDRLAQIILARTYPFKIEEAKELRPSDRGVRGFGSSGK